jgi:DNA-directed RNA polymerase specialized sigma24 family protein
MKKEWVLTQEAFDTLLDWLDVDRERAGRKYEEIRVRLIKIFTCRGCSEAEELADETINRVVAKIGDIAADYEGDCTPYFCAVSQKVYLEYLRKVRARQADIAVEDLGGLSFPAMSVANDIEPVYECLEHCLDHLPPPNRKLVVQYYQQEKHAKIENRQRLAMELGIAVNALRIRAHRMRRALRECVRNCLEEQPAN